MPRVVDVESVLRVQSSCNRDLIEGLLGGRTGGERDCLFLSFPVVAWQSNLSAGEQFRGRQECRQKVHACALEINSPMWPREGECNKKEAKKRSNRVESKSKIQLIKMILSMMSSFFIELPCECRCRMQIEGDFAWECVSCWGSCGRTGRGEGSQLWRQGRSKSVEFLRLWCAMLVLLFWVGGIDLLGGFLVCLALLDSGVLF